MSMHRPTAFAKGLSEEEVFKRYEKLVTKIVADIRKNLKIIDLEFDDLMSYGFTGLFEAYRRYDHRGHKGQAVFSSFAYYRIRGAVLDGCRKAGWAPRTRRRTVVKIKSLSAVNDHMASEYEANLESPDPVNLEEGIENISNIIGDILTITLVRHKNMEQFLEPENASQEKRIEDNDRALLIEEALKDLEDVEKIIIKRFHMHEEQLQDIAADLGFSSSWASRIHARAIKKLRESVAGNPLLTVESFY